MGRNRKELFLVKLSRPTPVLPITFTHLSRTASRQVQGYLTPKKPTLPRTEFDRTLRSFPSRSRTCPASNPVISSNNLLKISSRQVFDVLECEDLLRNGVPELERCRRPCLVANWATLPQKWPPPPGM